MVDNDAVLVPTLGLSLLKLMLSESKPEPIKVTVLGTSVKVKEEQAYIALLVPMYPCIFEKVLPPPREKVFAPPAKSKLLFISRIP